MTFHLAQTVADVLDAALSDADAPAEAGDGATPGREDPVAA